MNQPSSRSPSLVVKLTSSCAAPRFGVGTTARAVCVTTYAIETGIRNGRNQHDDTGKNEAAAQVAAAAAVVGAPALPERPDPDPEQDEAGGQGEEAGEVVTGGSVRERVVDRLDAGDDAEEAEEERQRRTRSGPHARVRPGGGDDQRELCQPARQMVDGRHARLGLEEVVVDDVEPDEAERGQGEVPLGGEARQGASRRDVRGGNGHTDQARSRLRRRGRAGSRGIGGGFSGVSAVRFAAAGLRSGGTSAPPGRGAIRFASTAAPASRRSRRRTSRRCRR